MLMTKLLAALLVCLGAGLEVPRVTVGQLRGSARLMSGRHPFIVTGMMTQWPALTQLANLSWFEHEFPSAVVDYYPQNLVIPHQVPFLISMREAIADLRKPRRSPSRARAYGRSHRSAGARYLQWRVVATDWARLVGQSVGVEDPIIKIGGFPMGNDLSWMSKCIPLKPRFTTDRTEWPLDNWMRHMQLRMITIGEPESGMFFHPDGLAASTFSWQLVGRKRWMLCVPPSTRPCKHVWGCAGDVDAFAPDDMKFTGFNKYRTQNCTDFVVEPGEVLFYPSRYWHQTLNLDQPCVSMAARHIDSNNMEQVHHQLAERCRHPPPDPTQLGFPDATPNLSKRNCAALEKCFLIWKQMFSKASQCNRLEAA